MHTIDIKNWQNIDVEFIKYGCNVRIDGIVRNQLNINIE